MARPLRIEFPGALYHFTSRGDRQEAIYQYDEDHRQYLAILDSVCNRAITRYVKFVSEGKGHPSPWKELKNQIYPGSEDFVEKMQSLIEDETVGLFKPMNQVHTV